MVTCPKCKSNDVDLSSTGLPNAIQCLDCGHLFADTSWPFPTSLVNKPLNDNLPQRYNPSNDEESPI